MFALLRRKLGLPAGMVPLGMMVSVGMAMGGGGVCAPVVAEEAEVAKTSFDLKLEKFDAGAATIKMIIKEVRLTFTALGLKEAKELVEKAPLVLWPCSSLLHTLNIVCF